MHLHPFLSPQHVPTGRPFHWRQSTRLLPLVLLLLVCLAATGRAQTARLQVLASPTNGVTRLTVTASSAGTVNLQGSLDLEHWHHLQSGNLSNGIATFDHTNTEPVDAWYFRAALGPAPSPLRPIPKLDSNTSTSALITPETGGKMSLRTASGQTFELQIAPQMVFDDVAVRMTLVTNFAGFPDNAGFIAAVQLEPDGLEFRGPVGLTITYPTNVPPQWMLGYTAGGSNGPLSLLPSDSETNTVRLPITHFSTAGAGAFIKVPSLDSAYQSTRDVIFREQDRRARADREARDAFINHTIDKQTFLERIQLNQLAYAAAVLHQAIDPLRGAARADCGIAQVVVKREESLYNELGPTNPANPFRHALLERDVPAMRCLCAHELLDACEQAPTRINIKQISDLLIDAQVVTGRGDAQGCDLGSDASIMAKAAKSACAKAWQGSIRLKSRESQSYHPPGSAAGGGSIESDIVRQFKGSVAAITSQRAVTNATTGATTQDWDLQLDGIFSASDHSETIQTFALGTDCKWSNIIRDVGATTLHTPDASLHLSFKGGTFANLILSAPRKSLPYPVNHLEAVEPAGAGVFCPKAESTSKNVTVNASLAFDFNRSDPDLVSLTESPDRLQLHWLRHHEEPSTGVTLSYEVELDLFRGLAP